MLLYALFFLNALVNAQQGDDIDREIITRSIHKNDLLDFSVPEMFPELVKDPVIMTVAPGSTSGTEPSPDSQNTEQLVTLTKQMTPVFSTQMKTVVDSTAPCTISKKIPQSPLFLVVCFQGMHAKTIYLLEADFAGNMIESHSNFTVPHDEEIIELEIVEHQVFVLTEKWNDTTTGQHRLLVLYVGTQDKSIEQKESSDVFSIGDDLKDKPLTIGVNQYPYSSSNRILIYGQTNTKHPDKRNLTFFSILINENGNIKLEGLFGSSKTSWATEIEGINDEEIFLSFIPFLSEYLVLFKMNHQPGIGEVYAIKYCRFMEKERYIPFSQTNETYLAFNCTKGWEPVGHVCNSYQLESFEMQHFVTVMSGSPITDGLENHLNFTLVSNCNVTRVFCIAFTNNQKQQVACEFSSNKLPLLVFDAHFLDRKGRTAYFLVRPNQIEDRHHLMTVDLIRGYPRILTGEKLDTVRLILFLDHMEATNNDFVLSYKRKMVGDQIFQILMAHTFQEQRISVDVSDFKMPSGGYSFRTIVVGESINIKTERSYIKMYELWINVTTDLDSVQLPKSFGKIWVNQNTSSGLYSTILPFDSLELKSNDPNFTVDPSYSNMVTIKNQRHKALSPYIFTAAKAGYGHRHKTIEDKDEIAYTLLSFQSVMHVYKNNSAGLDYCGTDAKGLFLCRRVFTSAPLPVVVKRPVAFYAVNSTKQAVLVLQADEVCGMAVVQFSRGDTNLVCYPEYAVIIGELLYKNRSAVFVGRGTKHSTSVIMAFEAPMSKDDPTSLLVHDISSEFMKKNDNATIYKMNLVDDGEAAWAHAYANNTIIVKHLNIKNINYPTLKKVYAIDGKKYELLDILADKLLVYNKVNTKIYYIHQKPEFKERYHGELPVEWPENINKKADFQPLDYVNQIKNYLGVVLVQLKYNSKIYTYYLDLRFKNSHPLERLRASYFTDYLKPGELFFAVIDTPTFSFFNVEVKNNETKVTQTSISYPYINLTVNTSEIKKVFNEIPIIVESQTLTGPSGKPAKLNLIIVKSEFDSTIVAVPKDRPNIEKSQNKTFAISDIVSVGSHISSYKRFKNKRGPYLLKVNQPISHLPIDQAETFSIQRLLILV
jgi:hypothetical protein